MGLEKLSSVFNDISKNVVKPAPIEPDLVGGFYESKEEPISTKLTYFKLNKLIKIDRIEKFQDPSPLHDMTHDVSVTNNPAVKSVEDIKVRENQLSFDFGKNMKLGEGKLIFDTLFAKNHKANAGRIAGRNTVFKVGNHTINTLEAGIGSLGNLNIRNYSSRFRTSLFGPEPYIVNDIGSKTNSIGNNRDLIPFTANSTGYLYINFLVINHLSCFLAK